MTPHRKNESKWRETLYTYRALYEPFGTFLSRPPWVQGTITEDFTGIYIAAIVKVLPHRIY